ncbi:uncharacterized protein LOC135962465 isoform X2 [Calliphora vicina]|uniref:uncharacterized protein LOC135962465 isoform X2 n=1 Tax=Calliphora vicina TaxID=7373 RepID=UPI00325C0308
MDASEVLYSTPAIAATNALSTEMSLTPTTQTQQLQQQLQHQPTPLSPLATATAPTTPRTTTHTPREIPTMYILDQMYDDYMDQCNGNNITTPTEVPDTTASLELVACPICARTFNPVTLRKHVGICEKMTTKKRNIFDSSRQRREGTDLATYPLPKNFGLPEKATSSTSIAQARNERGQSPKPAVQQVSSPILTRKKPAEDLIRSTARASMRKAVSSNNTTPTATAAATNSSNVTPSSNFNRDRMRSSERSLTRSRGIQPLPAEQCPHCERCFGIKAYDRHVEWCKEKAIQAAIKHGGSKNDGSVAKARLEARTKYRAPCLKTKRSLNREKYSGIAGEEHEMEDTSKCSKTNGNKTQENSLMSMSMTSSMCSERKLTNSSATGNINEPAASKAQSNSSYSSVGSRKCTRDKSQTPQPPTTIIKTNKTAIAAATAATEKVQKPEPIINLEIQMKEFHLMGEQMTATAINKKRQTQLKVNAVTAAKIKPQKDQKQQQQLPEFGKKQPKRSNQKLKTTDVRISLPADISPALEQKKSFSDLYFKSMRCDKRLQASRKAFKSDNDHEYRNYHHDDVNNVYNHDEVKFQATEAAPAENLDLTTSLTFYGSTEGGKESEMMLPEMVLQQINEKLEESYNKMTMEQYFNKEDCFKLEGQQCLANYSRFKREESLLLDSKKLIISRANEHTDTQNSEYLSPLNDLRREDQFQDLIMKQSYPSQQQQHKSDGYDSEEIVDEDITTNSILLSVPKLDIPKSPKKVLRKSSITREISETGKRVYNKESEIQQLQIDYSKLDDKNQQTNDETLKTNIFAHSSDLLETDIFKDCLTDSDELRRRNIIKNETEKEENFQIKDKSWEFDLKSLKCSSKSHTFIRDLDPTSYKLIELKTKKLGDIQKPNKLSKSSEDLSGLKTKSRNASPTKHTPRTPTALRLPRLSTPPPQQTPTTTSTPKIESTRIKSLNICQPKRKKVLRQTVSCTNTLPMKAVVPLESLEICGVSSAPQMKANSNSRNSITEGGRLEEIEYHEENCNEFAKEEEEELKNTCVMDKEIKVIKEPVQLKRNKSFTIRSRNKYDELTATKSTDTFCLNSNTEDFKELDNHSINQKREIFISIETEQNDLDKSPISPNSIRNIVGNPQTVVEVEVDAAHDNKFSKISDDDDADTSQNLCRSKNFSGHLMAERLPNVQLNNAKNLIQKMQEDFRQMGDEMSGNLRLTMEHRTTAPLDVNMNTNSTMPSSARNMVKMNRAAGTPSGDAYGDSDELSSLDGYPLSSPNSRLGVSSKTSADSAYGSLSRQRSSELTSQRSSSRSRPMASNTANTLLNRPLTEESSLGRSRQLSASSSSSSEHALPPITSSNSFHKLQQQQQQQQQHLYNNNNNNNNIANDLDELMRYERSGSNTNTNNNYDIQPTHALLTGAANSHSNLESLQQYPSNSTMSSSMKVSKFCHECGSKFLLEQAKFCMDCGVKRIVL